ncbi:hypothetical protein MBANPS3_008579 [Mucor bainieri]
MPSERIMYNITPPRELNNEDSSRTKDNPSKFSKSTTSRATIDTNNVADIAKLLKARLQYAQLKLETGMSTEDLQQIERAFLCSPRQPRRPLPSEFPPTPASSSPHSRRVKRLLLSAMTPTQNSWRKKKRIREQKKNELIEDEAAARTILMLSSSSPSSSSTARQHPTTAAFAPTPSYSSPPHEAVTNSTSSAESVSSQEEPMHRRSSLHMYKNFKHPQPADDIYDAVSNVPNYEKRSRDIGQALRQAHDEYAEKDIQYRLQPPPPPAMSDDHGQINYNRPPQLYSHHSLTSMPYKPPPPPMFGRPLSEDPFNSKPIIHENVSSSRHSRSPPSPPLSKE